MSIVDRSSVRRYLTAPLVIAAAVLLRWLLWPVLESDIPFLFLWPAVLVAAWCGGLGPGLLATLLAALVAKWFLLEPHHSLAIHDPRHVGGLVLFGLLGSVTSLLTDRLHPANEQVQRHAQALSQQQEWLRVTLGSIGDAVITTGVQGRVTYLNSVAQMLTGWKPDEAAGKPLEQIFAIVDEQTRRPADNPVRRVLQTETTVTLTNQTVLVTPTGAEVPIDVSAAPIRRHGESILGVVLVFRDLRQRRQAEQSARESEARQAAILEIALDAVVTINHDGKIIEFNPAAEQMFGRRRADALGQPMADLLIPSRLRAAHRQGLDRLLATGDGPVLGRHLEMPALRADGNEFAIELAVCRTPGQGPPLFTAFIRDVTDRQRKEEELRQQAQALDERDRRKDAFLAVLAHELRNPLAPILNAVHLLRQERTDSAVFQQSRAVLERQVRHLSRLVDDLLDVSRIGRGKIRFQKERVDVQTIIERSAETVRPLVQARRHTLNVVLPPDPLWVDADPTRLEQILVNLLTNAAKYTEPGGRIDLISQRNENEVVIRVKDTGIGMAPDVLPRVFDLFMQGERALNQAQGGLGIGLTLVRSLVEMHGGKVTAHSAGVGQGSEFGVRLPLREAPPQVDAEILPPEKTGQSLRVLVVDDNADAVESLAMLLRLFGHVAEVAHSGQAALTIAASFQPDVILLDLHLPAMDGYQVAQHVRQTSGKQPMLVAVTGYGQEEDRKRSQAAGFDYHLVKPVDPDEIQELLRRFDDARSVKE